MCNDVSNPKSIFRTRRLIIRAACESDLPALEALNADPEVMRYVAPPFSTQQTRDWFAGMDTAGGGGTGVWAVDETDGHRCIGVVGLNRLSGGSHAVLKPRVAPDDDPLEVSWRFAKAHWGKGYATESGRALVARAFGLTAARVCAFALAANSASCRAIEKSGLRPCGEYEIGEHLARFFAIAPEDHADGA